MNRRELLKMVKSLGFNIRQKSYCLTMANALYEPIITFLAVPIALEISYTCIWIAVKTELWNPPVRVLGQLRSNALSINQGAS
jgi:hypothetical protein